MNMVFIEMILLGPFDFHHLTLKCDSVSECHPRKHVDSYYQILSNSHTFSVYVRGGGAISMSHSDYRRVVADEIFHPTFELNPPNCYQ